MAEKTYQFDFLLENATQEQAETLMLAIVEKAHELGCTIGGSFEEVISDEERAKAFIQNIKEESDQKVPSLFEGLTIPASEGYDEESTSV